MDRIARHRKNGPGRHGAIRDDERDVVVERPNRIDHALDNFSRAAGRVEDYGDPPLGIRVVNGFDGIPNGKVQANLTAFYYDYKGLQLGQRINASVVTRNADATIYGLEGEFLFAPDDHWLFDANLSHLHTSLGTFLSEDAANPAQSLTATTPPVRINLKGNELPHSPGFKVRGGAQYQTDAFYGDWTATFRIDATWQDSYFAREYNTPTDRIDSWGVIDLQVRLENAPQNMGVRFFVKNLTNGDNLTNIIIEDALIGRYRNARLLEPRTYGVIVQKKF